ncbi:MAG: T9SS type A sorting domain-containing protein [Bacteroidales bacterium]|nr:T9SS type A sorting domain-containing protein [Bacteroidales bacterium]MCF8352032.1 T9SS type A sorting domain-containing protein [Bacteroidales bacterium]MCF8375505.1 T9SS type A sorting domain-containing protein [Bacteroidales bacterium]MCF8399904.1 T9SS type A sorting domain-containing protein [Bacteroidales bacterium]
MKRKIIFIILLPLVCFAHGQSSPWERVNPHPTENSLNSITKLDNGRIVAVGDRATVLTSDDFGQNWDVCHRPGGIDRDVRLTSIFFLDDQTGWAAGSFLTLIKTTDGGESWECISTGTSDPNHSYGSIHFLDQEKGFMVAKTDHFYLKRSTDGGQSWETLDLDESWQFSGVSFISYNTGLLTGTRSNYYIKSTDWGESWEKIELDQYNGTLAVAGMHFLNSQIGFLNGRYHGDQGNEQCILKTTNGGSEWYEVYADPHEFIMHISFYDDDLGLALSLEPDRSNDVLRTHDGGESWSVCASSIGKWSLNGLCFAQDDKFIAAGTYGQIYTSDDQGYSWESSYTNLAQDYVFKDAGIMGDSVVVAIGKGNVNGELQGVAIRSTDRGQSWEKINKVFLQLNEIDVVNQSIAYVCGYEQRSLYKTDDAGQSWLKLINFPYDITPQCIHFFDVDHGWVVGEDKSASVFCIYETQDGGMSWIEKCELPGFAHRLTDLTFVNQTKAYITGITCGNSLVLRTDDQGESWEIENLDMDESWALNGVEVIDEETFFIYGYNGIAKTINGGESWYDVTPEHNGFISFTAMDFPHPAIGYAIAAEDDRLVYKTLDGGGSWEALDLTCGSGMSSLSFFDEYEGVVLGENSVIYRTTTGGTVSSPEHLISSDRTGNWIVYPNPFDEQLTISCQEYPTGNTRFVLMDVSGKIVESKALQNIKSAFKWRLKTELPAGIFILSIKSDYGVDYIKIVKGKD